MDTLCQEMFFALFPRRDTLPLATILKDYDYLRYVSVLGTMGLLLFNCFVDLSVYLIFWRVL